MCPERCLCRSVLFKGDCFCVPPLRLCWVVATGALLCSRRAAALGRRLRLLAAGALGGAPGLSRPAAHGLSLAQEVSPCLWCWQADFFTTEPPGKLQKCLVFRFFFFFLMSVRVSVCATSQLQHVGSNSLTRD